MIQGRGLLKQETHAYTLSLSLSLTHTLSVVYFDQRLGAAHQKRWLKYAILINFAVFCNKRGHKRGLKRGKRGHKRGTWKRGFIATFSPVPLTYGLTRSPSTSTRQSPLPNKTQTHGLKGDDIHR